MKVDFTLGKDIFNLFKSSKKCVSIKLQEMAQFVKIFWCKKEKFVESEVYMGQLLMVKDN